MIRDIAGSREPHALVGVMHDVPQRARQVLETVRPPHNVGDEAQCP